MVTGTTILALETGISWIMRKIVLASILWIFKVMYIQTHKLSMIHISVKR